MSNKVDIKKLIEVTRILENLNIKNYKREIKGNTWTIKSFTKHNYIEVNNTYDEKGYIVLKYYARPDSSYMAEIGVEIDFLYGFLERQVI